MNKIYILYHAHCTDGTGARYAAWKKFGDTATYIPVNYGKPAPDMEPGSRVYILDFSYPRDVLEGLQSVHKEVVVLDHHKTAEKALSGLCGCHFDMNKSGAVLAWEYFHPEDPVPDLLLNIQDRDLWKFQLEGTKEVHAGLQLSGGAMNQWDKYIKSRDAYYALIDTGKTLLKKMDLEVKNSLKKVKVVKLLGHKVGMINVTDYVSEVGNAISLDKDLGVDFAICYCITNQNEVLLSLRSVGDFDVSKIGEKFGGGGHKNASGARCTLAHLVEILEERYGEPSE